MRSYTQVSPTWAELLHTAVTQPGIISQAFSRFHQYSIGNQLLALFQCKQRGIQPGPIATFPRWKALGRYVRKGERAIMLCMPVTVKATRTVEGEQPAESESQPTEFTYTRFVYRNHWFVLGQTEGTEYQPEPLPGFDIEKALATLDIKRVPFTLMDGNVQGYAKGREVAINPIAEQAESTLFHEMA